MVVHPFSAIGAFAIGGPAALLAGVVYCVLALAIVFTFPRATVRAWSGAAVGAAAGFVGAAIYFQFLLAGWPNFAAKIVELQELALFAGITAGFLSGWLLPVGRHGLRTDERKNEV